MAYQKSESLQGPKALTTKLRIATWSTPCGGVKLPLYEITINIVNKAT